MEGSLTDGVVRVGDDARQRFHDSRGYGRPLEGNALALAPVEAAHLLYRGDLGSVDRTGFMAFLAANELGVRFLVYTDLRERGFYLSPAREGWVDPEHADPGVDFVVYPRGSGPWDGLVEYRVRCVGERDSVAAASLGDVVLAVVDEDGDRSYFRTALETIAGGTDYEPTADVRGRLLADRVLVDDPPGDLYEQGFYGRPLEAADALGCSLVEAAFLADRGVLALDDRGPAAADTGAGDGPNESYAAIVKRGRDVEGERFDRRLAVYTALRDRAVVPKTGFKFGADFRTYSRVESVDKLGHSEWLVRAVPSNHVFSLRDLALDVRLAGGVRKEMVFALVGSGSEGTDIEWLSVTRLTP